MKQRLIQPKGRAERPFQPKRWVHRRALPEARTPQTRENPYLQPFTIDRTDYLPFHLWRTPLDNSFGNDSRFFRREAHEVIQALPENSVTSADIQMLFACALNRTIHPNRMSDVLNAFVYQGYLTTETLADLFILISDLDEADYSKAYSFFTGAYAWMAFYGSDITESFLRFATIWSLGTTERAETRRQFELNNILIKVLRNEATEDGHVLFESAMKFLITDDHEIHIATDRGTLHGDQVRNTRLAYKLAQHGMPVRVEDGVIKKSLQPLYENYLDYDFVGRSAGVQIELGSFRPAAFDRNKALISASLYNKVYQWAGADYWGPTPFQSSLPGLGILFYQNESNFLRTLGMSSELDHPKTESQHVPNDWNKNDVIVLNVFCSKGMTPLSQSVDLAFTDQLLFWIKIIRGALEQNPNSRFVFLDGENKGLSDNIFDELKKMIGTEFVHQVPFVPLKDVQDILRDSRVKGVLCPDTLTFHLGATFTNKPVVYIAGKYSNPASWIMSIWKPVSDKVHPVAANPNANLTEIGQLASRVFQSTAYSDMDASDINQDLLLTAQRAYASLYVGTLKTYPAVLSLLNDYVDTVTKKRSLTPEEHQGLLTLLATVRQTRLERVPEACDAFKELIVERAALDDTVQTSSMITELLQHPMMMALVEKSGYDPIDFWETNPELLS